MTPIIFAIVFVLGLIAGYLLFYILFRCTNREDGILTLDDNGTVQINFKLPWKQLFSKKRLILSVDIPEFDEDFADFSETDVEGGDSK